MMPPMPMRAFSRSGPTAELFADYAEMRVYANQGLVTTAAVDPLREALKLDPEIPRPASSWPSPDKQEGKTAEALAALEGPACRFAARCELAQARRK